MRHRTEEKMNKGISIAALLALFRSLLAETWLTGWELIKITVPAVILTKILAEVGFIDVIGVMLEPLMRLVGLPGSLGLVWATAMATSIYGGIGVLVVLAPGMLLTGSQLTVLGSMMLIAHALPIELSVSTRAGAGFLPIAIIRLGGALLYGLLLHHCCQYLQLWQEPVSFLFQADMSQPTLTLWCFQQLRNLLFILAVIFCIIVVMRVLKAAGLLALLERLLAPVLPWFGMSRQAAPITVVGMLMGIGYGGALIIREACSGKLTREEIFYSMALMGLCHSLIEDTLLIVAIGGKFMGIFWGRMIFALTVTFLLVKVGRRLTRRRVLVVDSKEKV
jgi:hypothetical protein